MKSSANNGIYTFVRYLDKGNIYVYTIDVQKELQNDLDDIFFSKTENNIFLGKYNARGNHKKFIEYMIRITNDRILSKDTL